ncbi:hypothetical protein BD847_1777 [Flavobacterium cutihirudinis]|uniref:Uncharacterized protein n=1 Tax=Flavobacterium cutihirudinis TaxID=1265740 RepID=A0A3D9FWI8_9FLAO|nr:hypothetical protein [Flavobacterium cutihirudinis]RED25038.1 hypothetical protein BD847_1777 [Flavobacterium cutihirudinis]
MKNRLLLLLLLLSSLSHAQKIRWDNLNVRREVQPSLFIKENPLDVAFITTSTDGVFFNDPTMDYRVSDIRVLYNDYIYNDLGFPKMVALLEYKYEPATLHIIKKDLKYQVAVVSHIYANLILIDPEKGVFDTQEIRLGDCDLVNPVANTKGFNSNLGDLDYPNNLNTTLLLTDLSEFEANQYRDQKNPSLPRKSEIKEVEQIQIYKLGFKVGRILHTKFHPYGKYSQLAFNYLKEDKDFNGENFNKASQLINTGINPIDESKVRQALEIWKTEASSITNLEDKKNKKYYIAIQENILQCYNVLRDFTETDEIANNLKTIDAKNQIADALISNKRKNAIPAEKKQIVYSPLPPRFAQTDVVRFLKKKKDMINGLNHIQPDYYDGKLTDMSIYKEASLLVKESKPDSEKFNILIDLLIDITGYEKNSSNYHQRKELTDVLKDYNAFCMKVANENKKFTANYDFKKDPHSYRTKLREHILSLNKVADFTSFNDALTTSVALTIEKTKPENITIAQDFIDLNTAMTLKQLMHTTKYDATITKAIDSITAFLDKKFPKQDLEVFFEFKNACILIKENKKFSTLEIADFSNTLRLLYMYC